MIVSLNLKLLLLYFHFWSDCEIIPTQRRLEALPGIHCNSLILSISRDAPSLFDYLSLCSLLNYKAWWKTRVWVPGMGTGYRVAGSGYRVAGIRIESLY